MAHILKKFTRAVLIVQYFPGEYKRIMWIILYNWLSYAIVNRHWRCYRILGQHSMRWLRNWIGWIPARELEPIENYTRWDRSWDFPIGSRIRKSWINFTKEYVCFLQISCLNNFNSVANRPHNVPIVFQVEVIDGKLFETFLKLTDVAMKKSFNNLREKPDRSRWISTGTTVNAFYSAILNSVSKYSN